MKSLLKPRQGACPADRSTPQIPQGCAPPLHCWARVPGWLCGLGQAPFALWASVSPLGVGDRAPRGVYASPRRETRWCLVGAAASRAEGLSLGKGAAGGGSSPAFSRCGGPRLCRVTPWPAGGVPWAQMKAVPGDPWGRKRQHPQPPASPAGDLTHPPCSATWLLSSALWGRGDSAPRECRCSTELRAPSGVGGHGLVLSSPRAPACLSAQRGGGSAAARPWGLQLLGSEEPPLAPQLQRGAGQGLGSVRAQAGLLL